MFTDPLFLFIVFISAVVMRVSYSAVRVMFVCSLVCEMKYISAHCSVNSISLLKSEVKKLTKGSKCEL